MRTELSFCLLRSTHLCWRGRRSRRQSMHEPIAELWVGLQISGENICVFWKKWVGPKNVEEKTRIFWKKIVGGYQITPGTNFQHMFRKFLRDPPLALHLFSFHFYRMINKGGCRSDTPPVQIGLRKGLWPV